MGRPREFDIEKALDTAGELFWRKGYEGTSLSNLTGAIGITPPSFYFALKSKEACGDGRDGRLLQPALAWALQRGTVRARQRDFSAKGST